MSDDQNANQNVSYQLGEIKGLLSGIVGELAAGRERHKNFTEIDADHERRISTLEAAKSEDKTANHEKRLVYIETRFAVYATLLTIAGACGTLLVQKILGL